VTPPGGEGRAVIAGAGIAGAVAACELRQRGFEVWLLEPARGRRARGIEAHAPGTVAALHALGLGSSLDRAGAVAMDGFENAWAGAARVRILDGIWHHVERAALARALRAAAIERGARVVPVERLPRLVRRDDAGPFCWDVAGLPLTSRIAVDATGRAARWSRPIARHGAQVASLFRGPGGARPRRGRIARTTSGWAYALFHPEATTVGVVSDGRHGAARALSDEDAVALGLASPAWFRFDRRCAAHAQWAVRAASLGPDHARLAVGDAALAYEPIAGQGVRFAVTSAVAAAACCEARPEDLQAAARYYDEFVASARRRHIAQLDARGREAEEIQERPVGDDIALRFSAEIVPTGILRERRLVPDVGLRLSDGELVRWLGQFDLLILRELAAAPRVVRDLRETLQARGLSLVHAEALVQWCVRRGVLAPIAP
jgi:2-polyprenyl-6-methoxyphenol hydroxylase-like FAD-dependent oxidoreductase